MDKIKTLLGIITIGLLIYLYVEHFPSIVHHIQKYLTGDFFIKKNVQDKSPKEESKSLPKEYPKEQNSKKKTVENIEQKNMFQPIDEYERKAEEEIDKLLELQ